MEKKLEYKIWGYKEEIYRDAKCKVDILYLKKDTYCSWHYHINNINNFILIKGNVKILAEQYSYFSCSWIPCLAELILNKEFRVYNGQKHQFQVFEDSVMIEIIYTDKNEELDENDIVRLEQGGKIIDGKKIPLDKLIKPNKKGE